MPWVTGWSERLKCLIWRGLHTPPNLSIEPCRLTFSQQSFLNPSPPPFFKGGETFPLSTPTLPSPIARGRRITSRHLTRQLQKIILRNRTGLFERPYSLSAGRQAALFSVSATNISYLYRSSLSVTSSVNHKFQKIRVCKALKVTLPGDDYATSGLTRTLSFHRVDLSLTLFISPPTGFRRYI